MNMNAPNKTLAEKVNNSALAPATQNMATLKNLLEKNKGAIAQAIPQHMNAERLARVALTLVRTTPALLDCSPESIMGGVLMSAQLGLELGMIGHAYLVPFNNRKTNRKEAQFIIGYRGMIDLARRSGNIESIKAEPVFENDEFELSYGLEDRLHHVPYHCRKGMAIGEPGAFRGAYAVAKFVGGGHAILYMPKAEIDAHRRRSKSSDSGPWVTDYNQMALKTVVRGLWKWLPISIEIAAKVESSDGAVKKEIRTDMDEAPDVAASTPDIFSQAEETTPIAETEAPAAPAPVKNPFEGIEAKYIAKARGQLNIATPTEKLAPDQIEQIRIVATEIKGGDF